MGTAEAAASAAAEETATTAEDETVEEATEAASVVVGTTDEVVVVVSIDELELTESEETGTRGSLMASVLLVGVDEDTCTVVVVASWAVSVDELVKGRREALLWCPGRCLHRDASAMAAKLPNRAVVNKTRIFRKVSKVHLIMSGSSEQAATLRARSEVEGLSKSLVLSL